MTEFCWNGFENVLNEILWEFNSLWDNMTRWNECEFGNF